MRNTELKLIVRFLSVVWLCATFVVGCASPGTSGTARSGAQGTAGEFEEIVVTGSAVRRPGRRNRYNSPTPAAFGMGDDQRNAQSTPMPLSSDEELWVISIPSVDERTSGDDYSPGSGAMIASFPGDIDEKTGVAREIPLPLKHTSVNARINGYVSTVSVRQQFANPFDEKIEAVYLFPLPEKAAISEFLMVIGDRKIRGILREKKEAEAIYREAQAQGYQASLLVQHRPNVFEQKVANIEPGKSIAVDIQYFHTLAYNDGWYSFVFPTVVGPRYNPPGYANPIAPVAHTSAPDNSGQTKIPYLRPSERSAHDISINVEIDAGVAIEELRSTHEIAASRATPESAIVRLADRSTIPNRDFVLSFRVAGEKVKSNLVTYQDPNSGQGYFTLMLYPPSDNTALTRRPMEMVFVLDCSGSMDGWPLRQAKKAVNAALDQLREGDTFQIIRFSENSSQLGATPLLATRQNLQRARRYLRNLHSTGGTQMIEGIKAALDFPHDAQRLRFVTFMTDGYIGNETDIIGAVHDRIGDSRIFSFGVGSSVNRYLLERMAKEGRGAVAYLGPQDSATDIMNGFFERISHPALTDVTVDWGNMAVTDVYPAMLPDLFVGRAVVVTGKYLGTASDVSVVGTTGSRERRFDIATAQTDDSGIYLPKIWARLRIADLVDRQAWEDDSYGELAAAIKNTALQYQLVSDYTSFIAVDASHRTAAEFGITIPQAIPVPDGVRYETTVER